MWAVLLVLACTDKDTTSDTGDTLPSATTSSDSGTTDTLTGDTGDPTDTQDTQDTQDTEPPLEEDCTQEGDEDGDGLADCEDPDCAEVCVEDCDDGIDNDGDGRVDCQDIDCADECPEDCENGQDDDYDGLVDCEDGECEDHASCVEICDNDDDDDRDGATDRDDDDCWGLPECAVVTARVTSGRVYAFGQFNYRASYGPGGPPVYSYLLSFEISASQVSGELTIDYGSSLVACNWRLSSMRGGKVSSSYYAFNAEIPVTWRSGWHTSGACGGAVGSDVLPDALSWYSTTGLALPATGPGGGRKLWYVGRLATHNYISQYNYGRTTGGRFYYSYNFAAEYGWDPLIAGDSTSIIGL